MSTTDLGVLPPSCRLAAAILHASSPLTFVAGFSLTHPQEKPSLPDKRRHRASNACAN